MQENKISVIVPVYNVENYLTKCIKSIINNTYRNLEIILVDDGATDSSGKLCDELSKEDSRIVVIHKKNGGLSSARNAGLKIAAGEYISFIDSDDYIALDMYEKMMKKAEENDADIIQCGLFRVDEEGRLSTTFHIGDWCCMGQKILDDFYIFQTIPVMVCNKLFRRSMVCNKLFVEGRNNEDNMFTMDVLPEAKCVVSLHDQLYYYLIRSDSIMGGNFSEKRFDSIYAYKYMLKRTEKIDKKYVPYVQYWRCKNAFYLWNDICRSNLPAEKKEKYKAIVDKEFLRTYPFVRRMGKAVCRKDRIRLAIFRINKNMAVKAYGRYLKGK